MLPGQIGLQKFTQSEEAKKGDTSDRPESNLFRVGGVGQGIVNLAEYMCSDR